MKKSQILVVIALVFLVSLSVYSRFFDYNNVKEDRLSDFANPKEAYGMLLDGVAHADGDTVFFDLIPAVQFAIGATDKDVVIIKKSNGGRLTFYREMINMWNVPNPTGEGKAMERWQSDAANEQEEKEYFAIFEKVVQTGRCQYWLFATESSMEKNFRETYKKSPAEAKELAAKVVHPLFSSLD